MVGSLIVIAVAGWIELQMWKSQNRGTPTGSFNGWGIFIAAPLAVAGVGVAVLFGGSVMIREAVKKPRKR
jgi:hypothetical protein